MCYCDGVNEKIKYGLDGIFKKYSLLKYSKKCNSNVYEIHNNISKLVNISESHVLCV